MSEAIRVKFTDSIEGRKLMVDKAEELGYVCGDIGDYANDWKWKRCLCLSSGGWEAYIEKGAPALPMSALFDGTIKSIKEQPMESKGYFVRTYNHEALSHAVQDKLIEAGWLWRYHTSETRFAAESVALNYEEIIAMTAGSVSPVEHLTELSLDDIFSGKIPKPPVKEPEMVAVMMPKGTEYTQGGERKVAE